MKKRSRAAEFTYDQKLNWFRSMLGRIIWCGISWPQQPDVHGYHHWTILKVDKTSSGVDFVIFSDPVTQNQWRVVVDFIWKAAEEEPGPKWRDYERQWGFGLEPAPDAAEVLIAAQMAQEDQRARGIAGGKP